MIPDKIQQRCLETWFDDSVPLKTHYLHAALGLNAEAGELASIIDKIYHKPDNNVQWPYEAIDELGDVYYYVVILAKLLGVTMAELEQLNADKLKDGHGWQQTLPSD